MKLGNAKMCSGFIANWNCGRSGMNGGCVYIAHLAKQSAHIPRSKYIYFFGTGDVIYKKDMKVCWYELCSADQVLGLQVVIQCSNSGGKCRIDGSGVGQ